LSPSDDGGFPELRLVRPAGAGDDAWRELSRSYTPVSDGVLGRVDTTTLANGLYQFALRVVDVNGQATLAGVTVTVLGDFKLGPFQVAFEDLHIDAAGLPVRVIRSYDSLQRQTAPRLRLGLERRLPEHLAPQEHDLRAGLGNHQYLPGVQALPAPGGPAQDRGHPARRPGRDLPLSAQGLMIEGPL
jgi:hypothetical protein